MFRIFLIPITIVSIFLSGCQSIDTMIIQRHHDIIEKVIANPSLLQNRIQYLDLIYEPGRCEKCINRDINEIVKYFPKIEYCRTKCYLHNENGECENVVLESTVYKDGYYLIFNFCKKNKNDSVWEMKVLFNNKPEQINNID